MALLHILPAALLATAVTLGGGDFALRLNDKPTGAELAFADAPHGVDPVMTGPVSRGFRAQQEIAGCATAKWPDVPLACFPNRAR